MNTDIRCACGHPDLSANSNQQFHLVRIPDGPLTRDCFQLAVAAIPEPKDGEVLLKTRFISVDAANRAWMQGAARRDGFGAGTAVAARGVGEVVDSRHPGFSAGDIVSGECGWQEYAVLPGTNLRVDEPPAVDAVVEGFDSLPEAFLGVLRGGGTRIVKIS